MTDCVNVECPNEAVLQFEHASKLVFYCAGCFDHWCAIMRNIDCAVPIAYEIESKGKVWTK